MIRSRLASIVDGRRVAVICTKHHPVPAQQDVVTIRFNDDTIEADIYAVNFYCEVDRSVCNDCHLIIGTVPDINFENDPRFKRKNFARDIADYPALTPPVELIPAEDWIQLAVAMPFFPLSGLVVLHMLRSTRMVSCEIIGMDFYANDTSIPVRAGGQRGKHKLPEAMSWLQALLNADTRFKLQNAEQTSSNG